MWWRLGNVQGQLEILNRRKLEAVTLTHFATPPASLKWQESTCRAFWSGKSLKRVKIKMKIVSVRLVKAHFTLNASWGGSCYLLGDWSFAEDDGVESRTNSKRKFQIELSFPPTQVEQTKTSFPKKSRKFSFPNSSFMHTCNFKFCWCFIHPSDGLKIDTSSFNFRFIIGKC